MSLYFDKIINTIYYHFIILSIITLSIGLIPQEQNDEFLANILR